MSLSTTLESAVTAAIINHLKTSVPALFNPGMPPITDADFDTRGELHLDARFFGTPMERLKSMCRLVTTFGAKMKITRKTPFATVNVTFMADDITVNMFAPLCGDQDTFTCPDTDRITNLVHQEVESDINDMFGDIDRSFLTIIE